MKYESNVTNVIADIKGKLKKASDVSALKHEISIYLLASNIRRIHNEGQAVNGKIGSYNSTSELYVNPKNSPRVFPPIGKTGKSVFKNGKKHKTGYFPSYKGFRNKIGRETGFVNLQLSGKLLKDWIMLQENKDWVIGFKSLYGAQISRGMEQKYGKLIWGVTEKDLEQIKLIEEEFIKKCLK